MQFFTSVVALAALASATPNYYPQPKGQYIVANYDDITAVPALPAANVIDQYKGLKYTAWAVNQPGVAGQAQLAGVAPKSKPNNIVSGVQQTALTGTNAEISTKNTKTKSFDLKYFYYGCAVNTAEGSQNVAQQCTFNVRAYRKLTDANPCAQQQFSFTPKATQPLAQPEKATFGKGFQGIQRIEIVQLESTTGEALNALVLDDVAYNLYK